MTDAEEKHLQDPKTWDWERAEARPGRKKPRAVVSVAFGRDDFETVARYAERAGMKLSEFIRSAALGCAEGKYLVVVQSGGSPTAPSVAYLPPPEAATKVAWPLVPDEEYQVPAPTSR